MQAKTPSHKVQSGVASVVHTIAGNLITNVTISDVGSLNRACERMNGVTSATSSSRNLAASLRLTSATNLEITTYADGACTVYVNWEVEYDDYQDVIQRGSTTVYCTSSGSEYTSDVTITDVVFPAQTRLERSFHPDANSWCGSRLSLTSNTNLRVTCTGSACNVITRWLVCRVNP